MGTPACIWLTTSLEVEAPRTTAPGGPTTRSTRVPAGSVGIGGGQTGIYPREGPGGWRLIGRTPMSLFDPNRDPPARLAPGQRVRFVAMAAEDFARHRQGVTAKRGR